MKKTFIFLAASLLLTVGCKHVEQTENVIGNPNVTVENGRFTPEVMWGLGKMGEYAISPDGSKAVYANTYYDIANNKGNAELYLIPTDGEQVEPVRLTNTNQSEFNPVWQDDNTLLFVRGTERS